LIGDASRLAFADRGRYMADSDFVKVPVKGLLDAAYLKTRSNLLKTNRALDAVAPGEPPHDRAELDWADDVSLELPSTSHISIVDGDGNAVSMTTTIENGFGSRVMTGGFLLNNELTDFSFRDTKDGKPVANRVEAGKRPRSSMAPTIVFDAKGEVVLVVGAAGGPTIPVQTARAIIGVVDFGLSANEALALPLIMAFGSTVVYEQGTVIEGMEETLKALGHTQIRGFGAPLKANALRRVTDADGQISWEVARDPRVEPKLSYE